MTKEEYQQIQELLGETVMKQVEGNFDCTYPECTGGCGTDYVGYVQAVEQHNFIVDAFEWVASTLPAGVSIDDLWGYWDKLDQQLRKACDQKDNPDGR